MMGYPAFYTLWAQHLYSAIGGFSHTMRGN